MQDTMDKLELLCTVTDIDGEHNNTKLIPGIAQLHYSSLRLVEIIISKTYIIG